MKCIALQSGSNGNCFYVEAGGLRLLFDAGISGKQAELRLSDRGGDIRRTDALFISHEHRDHSRCMGIYQRKFGLPIFATEPTLEAACRYQKLGVLRDVRFFTAGEVISLNGVRIETICTRHDAADGVGFVVDDGSHRLGILTDLGHVYDELIQVIQTLDAVVLESNYDPDMLRSGRYPPDLQQRIRGEHGHLSNGDAAHLLAATGQRLQWACLAHLSEENNTPHMALQTHRRRIGAALPLIVASRYEASDVLEL